MTTFYYKAISADGQLLEGQLDAPSKEAVIQQLQRSGKVPIYADSQLPDSALPKPRRKAVLRSKHGDLLYTFTQELMYLVSAGIPLDRSLEILHLGSHDPALVNLVAALRQTLRSGHTFSQTLEKFPEYFPPLYISLIQAAEAGGNIGTGLETLTGYLERTRLLREKVLGALLYPAILLSVSLLSILMILLYVVPQFADIITGVTQTLPPETQLVLWLSQFTIDYGIYLFGALALILLLLQRAVKSGAAAPLWDRLRLALPVIGSLHIKLEFTRFCRSLGSLIQNGVPLLNSLTLARRAFTNQQLSAQVDAAVGHLKEGGRLSDKLKQSASVPPLVVQLIQVGEETGELDRLLLQIADIYDRQIESETQKLLNLLEPAMIISLGLIIAVLILSLLSAIIGINDIAF